MLTLNRLIKVETYVTLAEIGIPTKSQEILAILQLAKELGGTVRAQDVNIKLLDRPGESPHAQRILMVIESYGLLAKTWNREEDAYRITEAGSDNLQNGQIMIPEQGAYTIYTTEDSLFNEAILRVERDSAVEQSESSAFFGKKNDRAPIEQIVESLQKPNCLNKYLSGSLFRQVANSNAPIQINSISEKVARSSRRMIMNISLELDLDTNPVMRVQATIGNFSIPEICTETRFNKTYVEVLEALTSNLGSLEVLGGEPTLIVPWNSITLEEAERFSKQITVEEPKLWDFGVFKKTTFHLPILPTTMQDATSWANYLIHQSINTYTDKLEYERKIQEVATKFSQKYDQHNLAAALIKFDELVNQVSEEKKAGKSSQLYWRLITPQDLNAR